MGKRIIVCDRKSLARVAYTGTLVSNGYEVVGEATTGMELVKLYESLKPDLILMSVILCEPGGDGLLIMRKLLMEHPEAAIVAYAHPHISSKEVCEQAGARGFFIYPARPDEMLSTVRSVIG